MDLLFSFAAWGTTNPVQRVAKTRTIQARTENLAMFDDVYSKNTRLNNVEYIQWLGQKKTIIFLW